MATERLQVARFALAFSSQLTSQRISITAVATRKLYVPNALKGVAAFSLLAAVYLYVHDAALSLVFLSFGSLPILLSLFACVVLVSSSVKQGQSENDAKALTG